MFHLMPYRDLPGDFEQRYQLGPCRSRLVRRRRCRQGRPVLQRDAGRDAACGEGRHARAMHQSASPERLWVHGQSEHHGRGSGEADQRPERRDHPARLDAAVHHAADAHRRGIRDARLHQRRAAGRRISHRTAVGRDNLQRRRSRRAARALPRGAGARDQGVVGERDFRLERQALSARHGEPLAAADPAAASADLDSWRGHLVDRGVCRRPRSLLLPFELLRRQERRDGERPLLGAGREKGA